MTQVGHTIVGTAIGTLCLPNFANFIKKFWFIFLFVFLANLPDLPIPYWGHDRYEISHSLFVNLLLIRIFILISQVIAKYSHTQKVSWKLVLFGSLAILSHLLLDSFYNHALGVMIFWPFSQASLVLPIPWLSVQKGLPPPITWEMIKIGVIEFITFTPFLGLSIWARKKTIIFGKPKLESAK